LALVVIELSPF